MRLGVIADIHGNAVALDAVLADAAAVRVEHWWALGDLVLFGPRPVEVMEVLASVPGVEFVAGNTDRYVLTGEQPQPHATADDAAGDAGLVERYGGMAGSIGWTRGALVQAGKLDALAGLPTSQRVRLSDGSGLLGVHASPARDDGPGIDTSGSEEALGRLLAGCGASIVVGGHTHDPTDRKVGGVRALNPGSVGIPHSPGRARWLLLTSTPSGVDVDLRQVPFDADAVVRDLHDRRYPTAAFLAGLLDGTGTFSGA